MSIALLSNPVLSAVAFVFGLCVGSFLNVVIYRLPVMMERDWRCQCLELFADDGASSPEGDKAAPETAPAERFDLAVPRSRCPHCGLKITALDNVPVLSYMLLKGRCRGCKQRISVRYPIIELVTGALAAVVVWQYGATLAAVAALALTFALVALTMIDADTQLLPDSITLPFLWLGLCFNLYGGFVPLQDAVIGAIAGYMTLWTVYQTFRLVTGKEGMGFGDFKLLAMLGAWLGWSQLPVIILLSSVVGAAVGISMVVFARHSRETPIPFGPYLAAAGFLAMLYGTDLSMAYMDTMFPGSR